MDNQFINVDLSSDPEKDLSITKFFFVDKIGNRHLVASLTLDAITIATVSRSDLILSAAKQVSQWVKNQNYKSALEEQAVYEYIEKSVIAAIKGTWV